VRPLLVSRPRQRNVELLESATEENSQHPAEWPEDTAPLGPGVKLVARGLLIKPDNTWMDFNRVE
jgi:hypothetical protein